MEPLVTNIEDATKENTNFRKVLHTGPKRQSQLTVMSIKPGENIGMEVHEGDQFLRIEEGKGKAILGGKEYEVEDDFAIVIPAGTEHDVVNTGESDMKLYSIYSPAEHPEDTVHVTKAESDAAEAAHHA